MSGFSSITLADLVTYSYGSGGFYAPGPGQIYAVHTNGGNYSAILITAAPVDFSSISFQFITFIAPTISQVLNNYSQVGPGYPNSGIALGSLFIIKGGNLASATSVTALQSSAAPGLPTTLNGSTVSVTVNGTTVNPAFYYATSTQLALVMPSKTPVGNGTITVTYNGQASPPFSIQVVANSLGFAGFYGYGTGLGIATNPTTGALYSYTDSIPPGTSVVLWGSGLGADAARDTTFVAPVGGFPINALSALYVGNIAANIAYQGASGYPGVNQLNVTIPANAPTGCHVPVVGVTAAGVPTNFITLPIGAGVCEEPEWGRDGNAPTALAAKTTVNTGSISLNFPLDSAGNVQSSVGPFLAIDFYSYTGAGFGSAPGVVSSGGCLANSNLYSSATAGLLAGNVSIPSQNFTLNNILYGTNGISLTAGSVAPGDSVTLQVSSSTQVSGFTATLTMPSIMLNWTNQNAAAAITKANGLLVTWTGGQPGTYVNISGAPNGGLPGALFTCTAPVSANQFTVPSWIFAAFPSQALNVTVTNQTLPQTFTSALDYGYTLGSDSQTVSATLQ